MFPVNNMTQLDAMLDQSLNKDGSHQGKLRKNWHPHVPWMGWLKDRQICHSTGDGSPWPRVKQLAEVLVGQVVVGGGNIRGTVNFCLCDW